MIKANLFARGTQTIEYWKCEVYEDERKNGVIKLSYGKLGGKLIEKVTTIYQGKNKGKKNETTPLLQANSEADSKILNKKRSGYKSLEDLKIENRENLILSLYENSTDTLFKILDEKLPKSNTDLNGNLKPMKAQQYYKDNGSVRINFPCYVQPKINGFRSLSFSRIGENTLFPTEQVIFTSKNGLDFIPLPLIEKELLVLFKKIGNELSYIFDGELYIHGQKLQTISSSVKKRNELTNSLEYRIFDLAIDEMEQVDRIQKLNEIFENTNFTYVKLVPSILCFSHQEAVKYKDSFISQGYEGAIFRDLSAQYQFGKRPQTMVKLKDRESEEFTILNIIDSPNNPGIPIFICKNDINDLTFEVVIEGTIEERKEYFINKEKYIGKPLTVEFYERTAEDKPFHAIGVAIRDYE